MNRYVSLLVRSPTAPWVLPGLRVWVGEGGEERTFIVGVEEDD